MTGCPYCAPDEKCALHTQCPGSYWKVSVDAIRDKKGRAKCPVCKRHYATNWDLEIRKHKA